MQTAKSAEYLFYGNSPKLGNTSQNVTATAYYPYTDKHGLWISPDSGVKYYLGTMESKNGSLANEALHCAISGSQSRNTPMTEPGKIPENDHHGWKLYTAEKYTTPCFAAITSMREMQS